MLVTLCTYDPASRYAMAQQFLAARDAVVLCGRCERRLESALASLRADFPGAKVALALLRVSVPLNNSCAYCLLHSMVLYTNAYMGKEPVHRMLHSTRDFSPTGSWMHLLRAKVCAF